MAFADRLKEARINKCYTQEQIAERIGVAKSTYTGYEKGNREPNINTIGKLMDELGVDANFLWQDEMDELGGNAIQLKYAELEHIKKYRALDEHGKEMVDFTLEKEYERSTAAMDKIIPYSAVTKAAHERTDIEVTPEMRLHDDKIMEGENF